MLFYLSSPCCGPSEAAVRSRWRAESSRNRRRAGPLCAGARGRHRSARSSSDTEPGRDRREAEPAGRPPPDPELPLWSKRETKECQIGSVLFLYSAQHFSLFWSELHCEIFCLIWATFSSMFVFWWSRIICTVYYFKMVLVLSSSLHITDFSKWVQFSSQWITIPIRANQTKTVEQDFLST